MFRTALRNVLAHKTRLLMTVLAVMLGVAFVSGTLVFTNAISAAYQKSSAKSLDHVDVAVTAAYSELTDALLEKSAKVPGAAGAIGVVSGYTVLADKDGRPVSEAWEQRGGNYWGDKDPRYPLTSGTAPHGKNEVAIDAETARRTGYQVGDTVRVSVGGPVMTPKIAGIFTTDDGDVTAGGSLVLFDTPTAQKLFFMTGTYNRIDVQAAPGTSQHALLTALEKALPKDRAEFSTGKALADAQAKRIDGRMSKLRQGLLAFAGISLFVGTFIIANTFTMLVSQRTRELALLRAVGASRRQVIRSVLIEAFVVGAVAGVAGLVVGIGIGAALRSLLGMLGANVPDGPLVVTSGTVVTAPAVGIVVTMLAAWLPGRRAAKIPPVAAMSSVHAKATVKSLVLRNTIGALCTGAGVAVIVAATSMGTEKGQNPMALGAVLLITGVFVLTPLLSRPLIAAAAPALRAFGVAGRLARQNALRNPRRTAATASALMIGLTLITGMTVVASSLQKATQEKVTASLRADYVVSTSGELSPDAQKRLARVDGVTDLSPLRNADVRLDGKIDTVIGVNGASIAKLIDLKVTDDAFKVTGTQVAVDTASARQYGWRAGSTFTVAYEDGKKQKLTVAGLYQDTNQVAGILVDNATLTPHLSNPTATSVLLKTSDGASSAMKDKLIKALGTNPAIEVQSRQDIADVDAKLLTLMLNMLYGLLAMAVIVAVLGVVNTLAMSVVERSQEIGMLRAVGLDRRGIKRMVRLESLVISLFGGVLGIGLGVFFGWAVGELGKKDQPTFELVLPWGRLALFLVLAAVVGVLAALWPARRAARLNMLEAIKAE
ncbi:ABC transporter permease [Streptomyces viridochromogenes]|uniref:Putative ABC transporter integral membrane protein n=1 Tax=Streptomyces viridochromogenes Tue57 TaxID=1160705 RepID=L8PIK7_STRVR|nr:ABC transporter permease [Streptomyces viridochromogenes]ELS55212.1 putative ABC transporter integral membrane protein [Streptomyces viridochromogenes Tue57]